MKNEYKENIEIGSKINRALNPMIVCTIGV